MRCRERRIWWEAVELDLDPASTPCSPAVLTLGELENLSLSFPICISKTGLRPVS